MHAYIMTKTALLIVDVQDDFLPPDGALAVPNGKEIIPLIKDLLSDAYEWKSVIATQVSQWDDLIQARADGLGLPPQGSYLLRILPRRK